MFFMGCSSLSFYLVICFMVCYGSPNVVDQRVDEILTIPHCFPAIWAGRAQIPGNRSRQNIQG